MKENSFLPSEEPQEQHQGEGAKGILRWNLLFQFLRHLWINHRIFLWASPNFSIIFKFCKWDISLQPLGDPREQHPGKAKQRTRKSISTNIRISIKVIVYQVFPGDLLAYYGFVFKFPNWKFGNFYNSFFPFFPPFFSKGRKVKISQLFMNQSSWNLVGISH